MRKKIALIVVGIIFICSSCKKDWICTCQTSLLGETVEVDEMEGWKKNEAADACKMVEEAQSYENCSISEK